MVFVVFFSARGAFVSITALFLFLIKTTFDCIYNYKYINDCIYLMYVIERNLHLANVN